MADESFIVVNALSEDLVVQNELFEEDDDVIVSCPTRGISLHSRNKNVKRIKAM